jgi:hypothetical protein
MIRTFSVTLAILLLAVAQAAAEPVNITAQTKAARASFLLTAIPPGPAATICLVDTGVNANADTSGVIRRYSISGDVFDQSLSLHGTEMAMFMGAPSNGFGMVGFWPAARYLSVRANVPGQDTFTAMGYIEGMRRCDEATLAHAVKVVVLPLASNIALTSDEAQALREEIDAAHAHGANVVAAAGNTNGQPVSTPANAAGVFSIGASDTASGGLCSFSAGGALLLAPGCTLDGADPATGAPTANQQGTSHAAVIAATALAALRTWRPDLSPEAAERLLNETGVESSAGRRLDLSAAFTAAGLGAIADPPPPAPTSVSSPGPSPPPQLKLQLPKPRLTARLRGHGAKRTLTIQARNRPRGAQLSVRIYARGHKGKLRQVASRTRASAVVRIRVRAWRRVTATFRDPTGRQTTSPRASLNAKR